MGGDELARHLDDGRQVEHDGAQLGVPLRRDDAAAAGAAAEVENLATSREIDLTHEATGRAQTDGVRRLVVLARLLDRESLGVLPQHDRVPPPEVRAQPAPLVPVRLAEEHPRPRIPRLALDEEPGHVGCVAQAALPGLALADEQVQRHARRDDPLGVGRREVERAGKGRLGVGAPRHLGEEPLAPPRP